MEMKEVVEVLEVASRAAKFLEKADSQPITDEDKARIKEFQKHFDSIVQEVLRSKPLSPARLYNVCVSTIMFGLIRELTIRLSLATVDPDATAAIIRTHADSAVESGLKEFCEIAKLIMKEKANGQQASTH